MYVLPGQTLEAIVIPQSSASSTLTVTGSPSINASTSEDGSVLISGSPDGTSIVHATPNTAIIVSDKVTAGTFWQTFLTSEGFDTYPSASSVLLAGPYLVRNASIENTVLRLFGDTNETTTLTILAAPNNIDTIIWNNNNLTLTPSDIGLTATLPGPPSNITLPDLSIATWKSADSLPEASPDFDDSSFVVANKTSTPRPQQPIAGELVLYSDEYGFHAGTFIYRGYFEGQAEGVTLYMQGYVTHLSLS